MENNKEQLSNACFQLALILATLSGMSIVAAGIFWVSPTSYGDIVISANSVCSPLLTINETQLAEIGSNFTYSVCLNEAISNLQKATNSTFSISWILLVISGLLAIGSIQVWFWGYWKIKIDNFNEGRYLLATVITIALLIILTYILIKNSVG